MVSTGYIYYKSITIGRGATVSIGMHQKEVLCPKNGIFRHSSNLTITLHFEFGLTKCLILTINISEYPFPTQQSNLNMEDTKNEKENNNKHNLYIC